MKKGYVQVTDSYERIVHWMLAISCLLLCVTGLGMMFQTFNFFGVMFGGLKNLKLVHNFTGLVFAISLVLAIRMWWKEAGVFVFPEDLEWIKAAGGYLWHVDNVPETGKYNPGQKAFFLTVAACGVIDDFHGSDHVVSRGISGRIWCAGCIRCMLWALWRSLRSSSFTCTWAPSVIPDQLMR